MPEFTFTWQRFNELQRKAAAEDLSDLEADEFEALTRVWEEAKAEGRRREERQAAEERQRRIEATPSDPDGSVAAHLASFAETRRRQRAAIDTGKWVEVREPDGRSFSRHRVLNAPPVYIPSAGRSGLEAIKRGLAE
jgi:hypothetical protein